MGQQEAEEPVAVIIPAHDEREVIGRCLASLSRQDHRGSLTVVVVANGCRDDTAVEARKWEESFSQRGWGLRVLERTAAGKPAALDAGDEEASPGIRVYLDADVEISANAISALSTALRKGSGWHLACPALVVAPPASSFSRSFARIWTDLDYVRSGVFGCGCLAVSRHGRSRWSRFPEIISDDGYVRGLFLEEERVSVPEASFTIRLPEGLRELVRMRSRWYRGARELARRFPELDPRSEVGGGDRLLSLLLRSAALRHLPAFLLVTLLARWRAHRLRGKGVELWERTERPI